MNLLLLEPDERVLGPRDVRTRHIRRVLRLGPGDRVRAGEIGGRIGIARIVRVAAGGLELDFEPSLDPPALPPVEILLGHPRPIVLRRLLRDLAAIGPARVLVVATELGERSYFDSTLWDDTRTPMLEGASQGGSTLVPQLERARSLETAVSLLRSPLSRRLVLHQREGAAHFGRESVSAGARWAAVAVGSERGWSDREVELLLAHGFSPCTLGPRTLRTETAAVIAAWQAVSWYHGRHEGSTAGD